MKVMAYVHSLQDKKTDRHHTAEVIIIEHRDNNNVVAEYNGVRCTAVYNPFAGAYFVSDIYGKLPNEQGTGKR